MGRDVVVDIIGNDKTGAAFKSASGNAEKAQGQMDKFKGSLEKAGVAAAALAGGAAVLGKLLSDSVAQGLAKANAQTALGAAAYADLEAQAGKVANKMGMTTTEFIKTGGQVAILAKNLGFGAEEAARFGGNLPVLADRLAMLSAGQLGAAEASDVLRSALAGEYDPLQAVGIAISADIVEREKQNILKERGAELSDLQAGALAVEAIVTRQTALANEVAATSAGKHAMAIEQSKAEMKEMYDTIVQNLLPAFGSLAKAFNDGRTVADEENGALKATHQWLKGVNMAINEAMPGWLQNKKMLEDNADATQQVAQETDAATKAAQDYRAALDAETQASQRALTAAKEKADQMLGSRDAQRAYQAAIEDATEALKKNGAGLDITTAKGRENESALDGMARAALGSAEAVLKQTGSNAQMQASMAVSFTKLTEMAVRFGMTKDAADAYARKLLGIPKEITTTLTLITTQAGNKVSALSGNIREDRVKYSDSSFAEASGGGRTGGPSPVSVTNTVMLDGRPFYAMTKSAVDDGAQRQRWAAYAGRRG